jgi:ATP-dependent DNA helicase RecG
MESLQSVMGTEIDKSVSALSGGQNRPHYSRRAVEEALMNALVHRDYGSAEPIQVTAFDDRIEISNPGGLSPEVSAETFRKGESGPNWRNPALALFLERMELVQRRGQGVPTIIRETERVSGRRPEFRADPYWVTVILPAYTPAGSRSDPMEAPGGERLILISIGGPSIAAQVSASLGDLSLEDAGGWILPGRGISHTVNWRR